MIQPLRGAREDSAQTAAEAEKWVDLMEEYVSPTELTAELLNALIEKIIVHEAVKSADGSRISLWQIWTICQRLTNWRQTSSKTCKVHWMGSRS